MKFLKVKGSKQHPHHNSNHWWLLKDREITRKDGEAFKVAVEDVLNDQRSFDLLDRKIVTREDGELFKKVIDYAIKEGYSYDLLWQKFVTRQDNELFDKVVKQAIKDHWGNELIKLKIITEEELELYKNKDNKIEAAIQQPNKPKPTTTLPDNMQWAWDPNVADWVAVLKDNSVTTPPLYDPNNQNLVNQNTTSYMSTVKSSCLSKFLDGPQYSKEIKIEAGLIKNGLVKYAGFDFNKGTKYEITEKGLEVLRKASEAEHNETLNEREKLAYLFGFNTDEISTLDTTGKVIKNSKKWTICEADGTELGEVEADSELDAKVKFGIEHPEYAESLSISAKCIDAKYEETTEQHLDYPNPSETPHDDVILENHTGWVNTAELEEGYYNPSKNSIEFAKMHSIISDYYAKGKVDGTYELNDDLVVVGTPKAMEEMKKEINKLGYYCYLVNQTTGFDKDEVPTYSLVIDVKHKKPLKKNYFYKNK